jgi:hypothetical protein
MVGEDHARFMGEERSDFMMGFGRGYSLASQTEERITPMEQQEYRNTTDYFQEGWKDALREVRHSKARGEWSPTLRAFWIKEAEADRKSFKHRCPHLKHTHTYHAGWIAALKSSQCQNGYASLTQEPEWSDALPSSDADEQEGRNMVLAFLFGIAITGILCFVVVPFWFGALLACLSICIILWLWTKPDERVEPRD